MIKKQNRLIGLKDLDVYIEDSNNQYIKVYELPDIIPAGKSSFLIDISKDDFVEETELKIEITNEKNEVIYTEYPKYREGSLRRVSIWVYNDDFDGYVTLSIVGELIDVPNKWKGIYNIKHTRQLIINKSVENDFPIRLYNEPKAQITESRLAYLNRTWTGEQTAEISGSNFTPWYDGEKDKLLLRFYGKTFDYYNKNTVISFNGQALVNSNRTRTGGTKREAFNFETNIINIVNSTIIEIDDRDYSIEWLLDYFRHTGTSYTSSYELPPTYTTTENIQSYAKINLYDLETWSGDISKVKTYAKTRGSNERVEYKLIDENTIESKELLISDGETDTEINTGYFYNMSHVNTYWNITTSSNDWSVETSSLYFINSLKITPPTSAYMESSTQSFTLQYNDDISFSNKDSYILSFNAHASNLTDLNVKLSSTGAKLNVYGTGTAFGPIPRLLEIIESETANNYIEEKIEFTPDISGSGTIRFEISRGIWNISDISLIISQETGFSPSQYYYRVPMPTWARNDFLDFKFEFYDSNENRAPYITTKNNILFLGSNTYIEGGDNLLSGSLYVGNILDHGIEIAGNNSAYMRSVDYEGWTKASTEQKSGFMIWSGSVLPTLAPDDNYCGVGLEMHDGVGSGSFKFRTCPDPIIEIITDKFFFGKSGSQYISGSNGNLIISSSGFYLSPDGVIISGSISASTGQIGGWNIDANHIYRNYLYLSSPSSSLYVKNDDFYNVVQVGSGSMTDTAYTGSNIIISGSFDESEWANVWCFSPSSEITDKWQVSNEEGKASTGEYYLEISSSNLDGATPDFNFELTQSVDVSVDQYSSIVFSFDCQGYFSGSSENRVNWGTEVLSAMICTNDETLLSTAFTLPANSYSTKVFSVGGIPDIETLIFKVSGSVTNISDGKTSRAIMLDNFSAHIIQPHTQLLQSGLLVYNSPYEYIKATTDGLEIKGGELNVQHAMIQDLEVYGDVTLFGDVEASDIPPSNTTPQTINSSVGSAGSSTAYSRGDHSHQLTFGILDAILINTSFSSSIEDRTSLLEIASSSFSADIISIGNYTASLPTNLHNLTDDEVSQLLNIDDESISNTEWQYLATLDQAVSTSADVIFNSVGINVTDAPEKLTVEGNISCSGIVYIDSRIDLNDSGGSVFVGLDTGINDDGDTNYNVFVGNQAGYYNTSGYYNAFYGYLSGYSNTEGNSNTFVGSNSGYSNTIGDLNVAIGQHAGTYEANGITGNVLSNYCTLIGADSKVQTSGDENEVVIGYDAIGKGSNTIKLGNTNIDWLYTEGSISSSQDIYASGTIYATDAIIGGIYESQLRTAGVRDYETGTVLVWKDKKLQQCQKRADTLVIGVSKYGHDEPIIIGAEHILVTGKVKEGDFLITSNKIGHAEAVKQKAIFKKNLFGKVIAQALQNSNKKSNLIFAMIRKM